MPISRRFNIAYQFTDGDRDMVIKQSEMLVNDYEVIPYKVISSLTSEVNYGGRVTDNWDRRLMTNLLSGFHNEGVISEGYNATLLRPSTNPEFKTLKVEAQDWR